MTARQGIAPASLATLSAETPRSEIRQRQGPGGKMLDYIDARFVMDRLDQIGPENWQDRYEDRIDGSVRCGIGILIDGEWVWKWDVGEPTDIEATLGSYSHAFKRAAVKWGIARDLYNHTPTSQGRSGGLPPSAAVTRLVVPRSAPPPGGAPQEPEYLADAFQEPLERPKTPAGHDGGTCPAHPDRAWTNGKYGWYCTGKAVEGYKSNARGYCAEKPTPKWVALQEVAS